MVRGSREHLVLVVLEVLVVLVLVCLRSSREMELTLRLSRGPDLLLPFS